MSEKFLMKKNIDRSLFKRGFAIPAEMQAVFSLHLSGGELNHGEKRAIKIILNEKIFDATLTSVNFDREKYPGHRDIWQIVYSQNSAIADSIRKIFSYSLKNFSENLPPSEEEYFVLYATDTKDIFYFEPIFKREIITPERDELSLENLFELPTLTDSEAAIVEKYRLTKIRKLNRSIGNYLKKLYNFRCQICGQNIGANYGVNVVECHHINYFVDSLNNDAENLLIVCPNHHRIIHAANPIFDRDKKFYRYPNGYEESLLLNLHL
ncbi:MAG: hypothetical protein IJS29_04400 [Selenomonadaceae bacterium]|nr:hypothetical protein [Selenomonadaceae bacterium]